jgi:hypothetical protein
MKSESELRAYMDRQGVSYSMPIYTGVAKMRVMDLTQLPQTMRGQFDDRGFFIAPEDKPSTKGSKK